MICQYGDWINIWFELNPVKDNKRGFDKMIGNVPELYEFSDGKESYNLTAILTFWFYFSNAMALPILALKNNEIKIYLEINTFDKCYSRFY